MSFCRRFLFISALFTLISGYSWAQKGAIRGQVIDDSNGEPLIGATVTIIGTTLGSATDLDGRFLIPNVDAGTVSLQVSFISYSTVTINEVIVKGGETTVINNIHLKEEAIGLEEVVVQATVLKNSESALLTTQRKSSLVLDGISADMFSKNNDSDAASAIRRVTGVSVEGGKYVVVRGIGDRYVKTSVNKAEIPSLDPNKNAVQMDLFPSNLLDNMVIYKTFSPELPGSFSGGYVDISTKEFPDRFTLQASVSSGFNTNATFNDNFLSAEKSTTHFTGFSGGIYDLPTDIANSGIPAPVFTPNSPIDAEVDRKSKSFTTVLDPRSNAFAPPVNHSASFSIGNQHTLLKRQLGYVVGLSYQRSYEHYDNGKTGRFFLPSQSDDDLIVVRDFEDTKSNESVLWGALANVTYKLSNTSKIGFNAMRNQSSDLTSRFLQGSFPADANQETEELQTRAIRYLERGLTSFQLKGDHKLGGLKIDWSLSQSKSFQDEPDFRFFNNIINVTTDATTYATFQNATGNPSRYYRELEETDYDAKLNFELPFNISNRDAKVKFGGAYLNKDRDFTERIVTYRRGTATNPFDGNVANYFSNANLGIKNTSNNSFGIYATELGNVGGSYSGDEQVPALYAMTDVRLSKSVKVSFGARYEGTDIFLTNASVALPDSLKQSVVKRNDVLPAVNLTYELSDKMNLRFGYGKTVARPTFRELAQYTTFDFVGDAFEVGNSNLTRTSIENFDLRFEVFPRVGEYIAASIFYKKFTSPIERVTSPFNNEPKDGLTFFFRNVPEATVYGTELELRKGLDFISPSLANFKIGTNVSFLVSEIDINPQELETIRVNQPDAEATRPLFGQSPYLVNALVSYAGENNGLSINASYNVIGPRLFLVSTGGTPNVFEQPRHLLDLNAKQKITPKTSVKLSAQNILDAPFRFTQNYSNKEYTYQSFQVGSTFSIGFSYLVE